jgi:hypothetical protein
MLAPRQTLHHCRLTHPHVILASTRSLFGVSFTVPSAKQVNGWCEAGHALIASSAVRLTFVLQLKKRDGIVRYRYSIVEAAC